MSSPAPAIAPAKAPIHAYLVMAMGVVAVSLSAIFIRLAQGEQMPSLYIAAARLTLASLILTPITLRRHRDEIARLSRDDVLLAALSGLFLAGHFASWIYSLQFTTVLISTVLVNTHPLWVALLEMFFLRARLGRLVGLGLVVGITGSAIVALPAQGSVALGNDPLLGGTLAVIGAITVAVYFVIGRKLRSGLSLLPYIWLVYSCAAIILLAGCILAGVPLTGYSAEGYLWIAAMAVFPQLLGHSSFNYVLKFFPATYVGIAVQLEPVLAAIVAFMVFNEGAGALQVLGSATILAGVILASLGQARSN